MFLQSTAISLWPGLFTPFSPPDFSEKIAQFRFVVVVIVVFLAVLCTVRRRLYSWTRMEHCVVSIQANCQFVFCWSWPSCSTRKKKIKNSQNFFATVRQQQRQHPGGWTRPQLRRLWFKFAKKKTGCQPLTHNVYWDRKRNRIFNESKHFQTTAGGFLFFNTHTHTRVCADSLVLKDQQNQTGGHIVFLGR